MEKKPPAMGTQPWGIPTVHLPWRSLSGSWLQLPELDTGDDESSVRKGRPSTLRRLFRAAREDCVAVPFAILGVLLAASMAPAQERQVGR